MSALAVTAALGLAAAVVWHSSRRPSRSRYCSAAAHEARVSSVVASLARRPPGAKFSLHRRTAASNTIRNAAHKSGPAYFPVDLAAFDHVIEVDLEAGYAVVEPGILFGDLLTELLAHGATTLVVVELPGITVGGAIAGGGLESSSFLHGQFSDSVLELECLTPERKVCSPTTNSDLFYAVSASFNTVALLTRVKLRIQRAPAFVELDVERYDTAADAVAALCSVEGDCLEGLAFGANDYAVVRGRHADVTAHPVRRFSRHWDRWYYKTVRDWPGGTMAVPYRDYCFRYNYGAFWMADYVLDMLGGDTWLTRAVFGGLLDTKHLFAVLHSSRLTDLGRMRIIQDCYVPAANAEHFIDQIDPEIGVYPLWLCPIKATRTPQVLACHYAEHVDMFINVGIYGRPREFPFDAARTNGRLVALLVETGARSMLYAQTWHSPDQFAAIYGDGLERMQAVREAYGGADCFFDLYDKVALSEAEREALGKPMRGTEEEELRAVVKDIALSKLGLK
ncbi:hypothetical protein Q5752_001539 [Cryptotrichosporon argae]